MKIYKLKNLQDKNTFIFAISTGFFFMFALAGIYSSILVEFFNANEDFESVAILSLFIMAFSGAFMLMYGYSEDIRLRSPEAGETIEILFIRNVTEKDGEGNDKQKTFYLYSVDEVIYSDEREPTLLELGKKYFVNKDGELELKE